MGLPTEDEPAQRRRARLQIPSPAQPAGRTRAGAGDRTRGRPPGNGGRLARVARTRGLAPRTQPRLNPLLLLAGPEAAPLSPSKAREPRRTSPLGATTRGPPPLT